MINHRPARIKAIKSLTTVYCRGGPASAPRRGSAPHLSEKTQTEQFATTCHFQFPSFFPLKIIRLPCRLSKEASPAAGCTSQYFLLAVPEARSIVVPEATTPPKVRVNHWNIVDMLNLLMNCYLASCPPPTSTFGTAGEHWLNRWTMTSRGKDRAQSPLFLLLHFTNQLTAHPTTGVR